MYLRLQLLAARDSIEDRAARNHKLHSPSRRIGIPACRGPDVAFRFIRPCSSFVAAGVEFLTTLKIESAFAIATSTGQLPASRCRLDTVQKWGRVEEGRGARAARFPSPLIKPDVPISSIRLSDRVL